MKRKKTKMIMNSVSYRYQISVYALKTFRTINYIIITENEFETIDTDRIARIAQCTAKPNLIKNPKICALFDYYFCV